jgi:uncharacterized protein YfaS (alpha-2-macroglobulin family)
VLAPEVSAFDWSTPEAGARLAWPWPDGAARLSLSHRGAGHPWAFVTARAALPLTTRMEAGYRLTREVVAIEQRAPGRWSPGDVAEVRIAVDAQADMTWVVVDDAVPAGATILGSGLGRDSALLTPTDEAAGAAWLAWVERRPDAYRAYYGWVPKGRFELVYRIRLNTSGRYGMPPTRVEAMYAPEMFAELPVDAIEVESAP